MAYAAVICLKHTLEHLMDPHNDSIQIIESAYKVVNSLHKNLKELDSRSWKRSMNSLEEGLREELCKFEDIIESHVANHELLISEGSTLFSIDLKPEISSFTASLKMMMMAYLEEEEGNDDDDDDDVSSRLIDHGGNASKIVRYSDQIPRIKYVLMFPQNLVKTKLFLLVGMAGIGKTALAKQIFEDPDIAEHFEYRVWVRFGRKRYTHVEIARWILTQLNPDSDKLVSTRGDEEISGDLQRVLESKRCLIVLDDVWDTEFVSEVLFLDKLRGSRVLLTTRLRSVAEIVSYQNKLKMQLMNKEESWHLFCGKVFGEKLCPHELVIPGKKIVEKCEGLPLLIVTVANLLSKKEKKLEYWNNVAEDKRYQLLRDACEEIIEVLFPSYDHLPQHLKTCFLYMGVFPQDCEIPKSNIINLWIAEGFLEVNEHETSVSCAMKCLDDLVSNNVVVAYQKKTSYLRAIIDIVKTCGLHFSFWHLCNKEAEKNKFLHVFNNLEDCLEESIKGHRRLCIHNNVLFGIKDVHNSMEHVCASRARSLLCYGPYHHYEVPICFGLRLLKVLDALAIRFYDFPLEVLNLVLLRYLALTCNGKLPASIAKLRKLEFLIVGRHLRIKSSEAPSYMPMEIWDMKELQHLQIMGSDLPDPCGKLLPKLSKLLGVTSHSCTKEVLKGIPHLRKLGIVIELVPNATEPLSCFHHISNLNELESLKCIVVNPVHVFVSPPASFLMLPSCLKKLHLNGLGYPWEFMTVIASLPYLEELKLRCFAFRGSKWEIQEHQFTNLGVLLIEDTALVQLKVGLRGFPSLRIVSIKHCYKLQELHLDLLSGTMLEHIELVDCNPLAVSCVDETIKLLERNIEFIVHSSWNDGNLKSSQLTNSSKRKFLKAR